MEKSESRKIQQEANPSIKNENENTVIQKEAGTSSGNENGKELLVNDIKKMFGTFERPLSAKCRIYKVPYHLRKWNNAAYTPRVISIGPIHHNKKRFQTMENNKVRYYKSFMERGEIELDSENLLSSVIKMEDSIRCCYVETVRLKSDDFVKMILLDAIFVLELFLRNFEGLWEAEDPMLVEAWLLKMVRHELLLLENQLPFFVIEELYKLALPFKATFVVSLIELSFGFFNHLNIHQKNPVAEIQHFTDLLRFFQLPPPNMRPGRINKNITLLKYTATQLNEAGVIFDKGKGVLDLKFEGVVLKIPVLTLDDQAEDLVRNIMALEQCDCKVDAYITEFYAIVDGLINTTKDVNLLCDIGIVNNLLGDNNAVTSMFNNLCKGVFLTGMNSDYNDLCIKLNAVYEVRCNRWKAALKQQYFSTPWRTASTIAAILLLVLTLIQTICSIIQVV